MFLFKKRERARRKIIDRLYGAIVAQARTPAFYLDFGVPDTLEGRFDLLVLHLHLANARLAAAGQEGIELGQELLDRFFEDMDGSLREIGIGDLSVPKKMRTLAEAYLGRSAAYGPAIEQSDETALAEAIARNVLAGAEREKARPIAVYAIEASRSLRAQSADALLAADIAFPVPGKAVAHAG